MMQKIRQMEREIKRFQSIARKVGESTFEMKKDSVDAENSRKKLMRDESRKIQRRVQKDLNTMDSIQQNTTVETNAKAVTPSSEIEANSNDTVDEEESTEEERSDGNETEIVEVVGVRIQNSKKNQLNAINIVFKWNTGRVEVTPAENVIMDAWECVLEYMKGVVDEGIKENCDKIRRLIPLMKVHQGRSKKKRKAMADFVKVFEGAEARSEDEDGTPSDQSGVISVLPCCHDMMELEEEKHAGTCGEGYKLFRVKCAICEAIMVQKGKVKKGEIFRPSPSTPAFMCRNIRNCGFAVCSHCRGTELVKEGMAAGRRQQRKRGRVASRN